jgi:hypothetical protein
MKKRLKQTHSPFVVISLAPLCVLAPKRNLVLNVVLETNLEVNKVGGKRTNKVSTWLQKKVGLGMAFKIMNY